MLNYLTKVFEQTGTQLLMFIVPSLLLAMLMQVVTRSVALSANRAFGTKLYLLLFGWFGVAIHELGHALFCLIFMHKIDELKLFRPDSESGTLGYVRHSYNPSSLYQRCGNFFMGIGPIVLGVLVIFISAKLLMASAIPFHATPESAGILDTLGRALNGAFDYFLHLFNIEALSRWQTYLFLYISFSVGSTITLSSADVKGALSGFVSLVVMILVLNFLTLPFGDFGHSLYTLFSPSYQFFYAIIFFVLLTNICFKLLLLPFNR